MFGNPTWIAPMGVLGTDRNFGGIKLTEYVCPRRV